MQNYELRSVWIRFIIWSAMLAASSDVTMIIICIYQSSITTEFGARLNCPAKICNKRFKMSRRKRVQAIGGVCLWFWTKVVYSFLVLIWAEEELNSQKGNYGTFVVITVYKNAFCIAASSSHSGPSVHLLFGTKNNETWRKY